MHVPIDPFTQRRISDVLRKALRLGLDPAEQLHSEGLILTPDKDREIRAQAMQYMVLRVEEYRPAEFMRRKNPTEADMYQHMLEFLRELLATERQR